MLFSEKIRQENYFLRSDTYQSIHPGGVADLPCRDHRVLMVSKHRAVAYIVNLETQLCEAELRLSTETPMDECCGCNYCTVTNTVYVLMWNKRYGYPYIFNLSYGSDWIKQEPYRFRIPREYNCIEYVGEYEEPTEEEEVEDPEESTVLCLEEKFCDEPTSTLHTGFTLTRPTFTTMDEYLVVGLNQIIPLVYKFSDEESSYPLCTYRVQAKLIVFSPFDPVNTWHEHILGETPFTRENMYSSSAVQIGQMYSVNSKLVVSLKKDHRYIPENLTDWYYSYPGEDYIAWWNSVHKPMLASPELSAKPLTSEITPIPFSYTVITREELLESVAFANNRHYDMPLPLRVADANDIAMSTDYDYLTLVTDWESAIFHSSPVGFFSGSYSPRVYSLDMNIYVQAAINIYNPLLVSLYTLDWPELYIEKYSMHAKHDSTRFCYSPAGPYFTDFTIYDINPGSVVNFYVWTDPDLVHTSTLLYSADIHKRGV